MTINKLFQFLLITPLLIFGIFFVSNYSLAFCQVASDLNTYSTINGNVVYCDNSYKMWTTTFTNLSGNVASTTCANLVYAGQSNW